MKSERPPVVAGWLLERFCPDPGLAGDLIEEYGARRSRAWYWKQALGAVCVYPISQILEHKWLTARAIFTGWFIWFVLNDQLLRGVVRPWLGMDSTLDKAAYFLLAYALWLANGWIIAKLHRPYSAAMVVAFFIWSFAQSVAPVYASIVSTLAGSKPGSALAWEVSLRATVLLCLLFGGVLSTYRDQLRQMRDAHGWPHRPLAAR